MNSNANINWIVAGQPRGRRLKVIKLFFRPLTLKALYNLL